MGRGQMKYGIIAEAYDLGPFTSKIILEPEQPLPECSLDFNGGR